MEELERQMEVFGKDAERAEDELLASGQISEASWALIRAYILNRIAEATLQCHKNLAETFKPE